MSTSRPVPTQAADRHGIAPTVPVAAGVFVVYCVLFIGLIAAAGADYNHLFVNAETAWRAVVLPLAVGSAWLIGFLAWARWDWVFRDPRRLSMGWFLWVPPVLMVIVMLLRFAGVAWSDISSSVLVPILVAGVLVGFAEETLFRGIILRALRSGGRSEATAVWMSSLWFGLFHLTNLLVGAGAGAVYQAFAATFAGVTLYLVRRGTGHLAAGMVVHGAWDISAFLFGLAATTGLAANVSSGANLVLMPLVALIALILVLRRDGSTQALAEPAALSPAPTPTASV